MHARSYRPVPPHPISQIYQGRNLGSLDLPRSFRSGAAGFIGHGPLCHYWMIAMETYLDFGGAWWATGFKVFADQVIAVHIGSKAAQRAQTLPSDPGLPARPAPCSLLATCWPCKAPQTRGLAAHGRYRLLATPSAPVPCSRCSLLPAFAAPCSRRSDEPTALTTPPL